MSETRPRSGDAWATYLDWYERATPQQRKQAVDALTEEQKEQFLLALHSRPAPSRSKQRAPSDLVVKLLASVRRPSPIQLLLAAVLGLGALLFLTGAINGLGLDNEGQIAFILLGMILVLGGLVGILVTAALRSP